MEEDGEGRIGVARTRRRKRCRTRALEGLEALGLSRRPLRGRRLLGDVLLLLGLGLALLLLDELLQARAVRRLERVEVLNVGGGGDDPRVLAGTGEGLRKMRRRGNSKEEAEGTP